MLDYQTMERINDNIQSRLAQEAYEAEQAEEARLHAEEKKAAFWLGIVLFIFFFVLATLIP